VSSQDGRAGPFAALGLPARPGLTDDEVRAAWRRVATATHPDRPDGGDPDRFAMAAAAYTALRTRSGRGEALADLAGHPARRRPARPAAPAPPAHPATAAPPARQDVARNRHRTRGFGPRRGTPARSAPARPRPAAVRLLARVPWLARIRRGRPAVLALRVLIVAAVAATSAAVAGWQPATPALITGALTWLACTACHDLAPPG
jgi:hypothetical protein